MGLRGYTGDTFGKTEQGLFVAALAELLEINATRVRNVSAQDAVLTVVASVCVCVCVCVCVLFSDHCARKCIHKRVITRRNS